MLLDTGLRASELVGLTMVNVNLEDGLVKVMGKGSKERIVPIGAKVQRALWKYLQRHRPQPANPLCPTLFLTLTGKPITTDRLRTIIEKYSIRADIEGVRCSPHTLRHTFAISYLRNGGDVFSLQRILGHSSLEIVRYYVNLAQADIKELVNDPVLWATNLIEFATQNRKDTPGVIGMNEGAWQKVVVALDVLKWFIEEEE